MAKMANAKPKNRSDAYDHVFDNNELGLLISKVQSTVISNGKELDKAIIERVPPVEDLDRFLTVDVMPDGVFVSPKAQVKKCDTLDFNGSEPDFIIFRRRNNSQRCHVIELKYGHVFDTKKANAERQAIHGFIERNASELPFKISAHFVCFFRDDRQSIWEGFKRRIALEEAMTGREFCKLLEIDYAEIANRT